jgi:hypothetical protein
MVRDARILYKKMLCFAKEARTGAGCSFLAANHRHKRSNLNILPMWKVQEKNVISNEINRT